MLKPQTELFNIVAFVRIGWTSFRVLWMTSEFCYCSAEKQFISNLKPFSIILKCSILHLKDTKVYEESSVEKFQLCEQVHPSAM